MVTRMTAAGSPGCRGAVWRHVLITALTARSHPRSRAFDLDVNGMEFALCCRRRVAEQIVMTGLIPDDIGVALKLVRRHESRAAGLVDEPAAQIEAPGH